MLIRFWKLKKMNIGSLTPEQKRGVNIISKFIKFEKINFWAIDFIYDNIVNLNVYYHESDKDLICYFKGSKCVILHDIKSNHFYISGYIWDFFRQRMKYSIPKIFYIIKSLVKMSYGIDDVNLREIKCNTSMYMEEYYLKGELIPFDISVLKTKNNIFKNIKNFFINIFYK